MEVSVHGTLQKAEGVPYGTHTINNYDELYALKSDGVDLEEYVGREVTPAGKQLEGYADPYLVNVESVDSY